MLTVASVVKARISHVNSPPAPLFREREGWRRRRRGEFHSPGRRSHTRSAGQEGRVEQAEDHGHVRHDQEDGQQHEMPLGAAVEDLPLAARAASLAETRPVTPSSCRAIQKSGITPER